MIKERLWKVMGKSKWACFLKLAGTFYVQVRVKVLDLFFYLLGKTLAQEIGTARKIGSL